MHCHVRRAIFFGRPWLELESRIFPVPTGRNLPEIQVRLRVICSTKHTTLTARLANWSKSQSILQCAAVDLRGYHVTRLTINTRCTFPQASDCISWTERPPNSIHNPNRIALDDTPISRSQGYFDHDVFPRYASTGYQSRCIRLGSWAVLIKGRKSPLSSPWQAFPEKATTTDTLVP